MTIDKILGKLTANSSVVALLLVFVVVYQSYFIFFGLDFQDGFYHINRMISNQPYVMAFLSYKIGYLWYLIFGKSILGFRIFNLIIYLFALFCPIILVREKRKYLILLVITNFFYALLNWNLIGYDTFSMFFVVLTTVFVIQYLNQPNYKSLFLVTLFSALAIACRLPNLLILPAISAVFFLNKNKVGLKSVLIFFLTTLVFFSGIVLIFYGRLQEYFLEIKNASAGSSEDHSLTQLIQGYVNHLLFIVKIVLVLLSLYFIYTKYWQNKIGKAFVILVSILLFVLYYKKIFATGFNTKAALFFAGVVMSIGFIQLLFVIKNKKDRNNFLQSFLPVLVLAFIPCLGSNSGLKYAGFFVVFLPFMWLNSNLKGNYFFIVLLTFLIPFTVVEKYRIKFMDESQNQLVNQYETNHLKGIYSTPERINYVNRVSNDYQQYKDKKILFYGLNSHIFNYLYNDSKWIFETFAMKLDSKKDLEVISEVVSVSRPIFFITSYDIQSNPSLVEKQIMDLNYRREVKKDYAILIPN